MDDVFSSHTGNGGVIGGIFAGVLAIFALVLLVTFVVFKTKRFRNKNSTSGGGASFENPTYLRETNVEQVHVSI